MMNFGSGYGPMFGGGGGFGAIALVTWLVWIVVGIFLAILLWQKINKK